MWSRILTRSLLELIPSELCIYTQECLVTLTTLNVLPLWPSSSLKVSHVLRWSLEETIVPDSTMNRMESRVASPEGVSQLPEVSLPTLVSLDWEIEFTVSLLATKVSALVGVICCLALHSCNQVLAKWPNSSGIGDL